MLRIFFMYFLTYLNFLVAKSLENFALPLEGIDINKHRSIASCIAEISKRELFWRPTVVFKIGKNQTTDKNNFIKEVFQKLDHINIPYMIIDDMGNGTLGVLEASYLFIAYFEDCDALKEFGFGVIDRKIKYIIIVDNFSRTVCRKNFHGIGKTIAKYDMSAFLRHSDRQYNLTTHIPMFDEITCGEVVESSQRINACLDGKLVGKTIFPHKNPTNMKKCPFKVGMGTLYPFAIIENRSALKTYDRINIERVKGMDMEIVLILTQRFNATLDLYYVFKEEENPYVKADFIPFVSNGSLEMCAGGLYRIYGEEVAYSGTYARQKVTWIYYVERNNRLLENLITIGDGSYTFIIFYFVYTAVWYLICKYDKHAVSIKNTLLYGWGALIGAASLQDARSFKQKILNVVYLNMCLHLSIYVSIRMYSFLTVSVPPELLKTNEDIMNSGRTAFLKTLTKYFIKDERYERFANTSTECDSFMDCAEKCLLYNGVTVYLHGYFYKFQAMTAVHEEARMIMSSENLLTVYYEMIMRKDSPLVVKFQKNIERLFEAGITEKLFTEAIGLTVVDKAESAAKNAVGNSYICQTGCKISMAQLSGVFYVWAAGCGAACCLFVIEIMMKRKSM